MSIRSPHHLNAASPRFLLSSPQSHQYSSPRLSQQLPPLLSYHPFPATHLRYDPYRRSGPSQPQPQPRLMPVQPVYHDRSPRIPPPPSGTRRSPEGSVRRLPQVPVREYEVSKPNSRYQPSRGAQRDARWHAKYAERSHLISHRSPMIGRVPPPHPGNSNAPKHIPSGRHSNGNPLGDSAWPPMRDMEQVRAEQQAAIAAARRAHAESLKNNAAKEEVQRKVRRIQLQVFVHARPTNCLWKGCQAVLNSWALLEKHIDHCHLHPRSSTGPEGVENSTVVCHWDGCGGTFATAQDCYRHCLVDHMGPYSARCPFNCLYQGPKFADLFAHIGRRHPLATPDDFVPGLIHHRPTYLPESTSDLPCLPQFINLSSSDESPCSPHLCGKINGFSGEITSKTQKFVARGCISGRRPRKDHFADKQGASAVIRAAIENSKRISEAYHLSLAKQDNDGALEEDRPQTAKSVPMTPSEARDQGVDLIDIKLSARRAKDVAKKQVLEEANYDDASDSPRSPSGPRSRLTRPSLKVGLTTSSLATKGTRSKAEKFESDSESSSSSASNYSLYGGDGSDQPVGKASPMNSSDSALKRSERLLRKAGSVEGQTDTTRGKNEP